MGNKYSSLLLLASLLTPMSLQQNVNQTAIRSHPLPQQQRIVPNVKEILNTRSRSYGNRGGYRTDVPPFRINVFQSNYGSNGGGSGHSGGYGGGGYGGGGYGGGGYGGGGYAGNGDRYRGGGYGGNFGGIVAGYGRKYSNVNGYGGNIGYDGGYVGSLGYNSGPYGRGSGGGVYGSTHYGGNGNNHYFGGNSGGHNGNSHFGDGHGGNTVYGGDKHPFPVTYYKPTEEVCKSIPEKDRIDCSQGEPDWKIPGCLAIGCCHIEVKGSPACYYPFPNISKHQAKCQVSNEAKKDCGNNATSEIGCLVKECCWEEVPGSPFCYSVDDSRVEFKKAGTVTSGTGPLQRLFSHINVTDS